MTATMPATHQPGPAELTTPHPAHGCPHPGRHPRPDAGHGPDARAAGPVLRGMRGVPPGRHDRHRPAAPLRRAAGIAPPPHIWFAERLLGVLTGVRAITCLAGHVRAETYDRLWNLANARADWRHRARGHRPAVHRCHVVRVADDALEVTAVVTLATECYRAIAFRLERESPSGPGAPITHTRVTHTRAAAAPVAAGRVSPVPATAAPVNAGPVNAGPVHAARGWRCTAVEAR